MNKIVIILSVLLLIGLVAGLKASESSSSTSSQVNPMLQAKEVLIRHFSDRLIEKELDKELIQACVDGTAAQVRDLFERGANLYAQSSGKYGPPESKNEVIFPAHLAAGAGNLPALKECINKGYSVADPALMIYAALLGQPEIIEFLLSLGVNPNVTLQGVYQLEPNPTAVNPLQAAASGYTLMTQMARKSVNSSSSLQGYCEASGHFACVELLVRAGAPINGNLSNKPSTFINDPAFLKKILDLGADTELIDEQGDTALHCAARAANQNTLKLLTEYGANLQRVNAARHTPLEILLSEKAPLSYTPHLRQAVDTTSFGDFTPSVLACLNGLLEAGADFTLPGLRNRIPSIWVAHLQDFITTYGDDSPRGLLEDICKASYVLFLPTHEEVVKARKELLHIIWCFNKLGETYSGLKMPYQKRDFILSHSSLRDQLIRLYLVRLRNTNPHGEHFFTEIENDVADYLYDLVDRLYHERAPKNTSYARIYPEDHMYEQIPMDLTDYRYDREDRSYYYVGPSSKPPFSINLNESRFKDFAMSCILKGLKTRSQVLKARTQSGASTATH